MRPCFKRFKAPPMYIEFEFPISGNLKATPEVLRSSARLFPEVVLSLGSQRERRRYKGRRREKAESYDEAARPDLGVAQSLDAGTDEALQSRKLLAEGGHLFYKARQKGV